MTEAMRTRKPYKTRLNSFLTGPSFCHSPRGSLALAYNDMNAEGSSRAALRHFTAISSEFYPQLYEHF